MTRAFLLLLLLVPQARADELDALRARRDAAIAAVASDLDAGARAFDVVASELGAWAAARTRELADPPDPGAERRRDLAELLLAEGQARVARLLPEGPERRARLEQALAGYDLHVNERGAWPDLLDEAYLGRIEALHDLGRLDDAIADALALGSCTQLPWEPEDPAQRRQLAERVRRTCLRAHRALLRALLAADRPHEALRAIDALEPRLPRWREHELGPALVAERAKLLAVVGRAAEGARELFALVERGRAAPDELAGLEVDRPGAQACVALAELEELAPDEPFPPAVQQAIALGHDLRGRPDQALGAWKRILVAARTSEERAAWVPRVAHEVGDRLWVRERFLEAAIAYETVVGVAGANEREALRFAIAAGRKAVSQHGEAPSGPGPLAAYLKRLAALAAERDGERAGRASHRAQELIARGDYLGAAELYAGLKPGVDCLAAVHAELVAMGGWCYLEAHRGSNDPAHLRRAREELARAIALASAGADRSALAMAAFHLGHLEYEAGRPTEALEALRTFDAEGAGGRYLVRARHQQALAHLALGDVARAEAAFASVAAGDDDALRRFAYELAAAFHARARAVRRERPDDIAAIRAERARAGRYAEAFLARSREPLKLPVLAWLAHVLLGGGRWEAAARTADELLRRGPRPRLDGTPAATEQDDELDEAGRTLGVGLVLSGRAREGWERLAAVRDTVHLLDRDGRRVARGRLVRRELRGPFERRVDGRAVAERRWFTVVAVAPGDERAYFDLDGPADGAVDVRAVEGRDPTAPWLPSQERRLVRPFAHDLLVADGLARASWARWEAERDRAFLANEVTAATNHLRWLLGGVTARGWAAHASDVLVDEVDRWDASWQADLRYLRIKLAREAWREVASDIAQLNLMSKSPRRTDQQAELEVIRREAEARAR